MAVRSFGSGPFQYQVVDNWARRPRLWPFNDVAGVGVDSQDRVYVFTRSAHPVMVFDKEGRFIRSWGEGIFTRPHGVFVASDDTLWCTDDMDHTVRHFDTQGNLLGMLGTPGLYSDTGYNGRQLDSIRRGGPPFNRPTKAVLAPSGEMYVTDGYGNARVHKFSADGTHLLSWGEPGHGPGQFVLPHSVVVDRQGRVYVADRENRRIQVFSPEGEFITLWPDVKRPTDMLLDEEDHLFVSELAPRVSVWDLEGTLLAEWGIEQGKSMDAGYFVAPHTIARDSRGVLYVGEVGESDSGVDKGCRAIQKFVPVN